MGELFSKHKNLPALFLLLAVLVCFGLALTMVVEKQQQIDDLMARAGICTCEKWVSR